MLFGLVPLRHARHAMCIHRGCQDSRHTPYHTNFPKSHRHFIGDADTTLNLFHLNQSKVQMHYEQDLIQRLSDPATREQAFGTLVQKFQEPLYWQIRHMVLDHYDTDDILQNVFIKAWQGLDNFRGDSRLSTWLYRIASNECLNFLQRQKQTRLSLSLTDDSTSDGVRLQLESDPYFDGDETEIQLQQAIQSLPPKQRQVFNMKYFQELRYEEMSEILGTSVGALKASYHHAVNKITAFFKQLD